MIVNFENKPSNLIKRQPVATASPQRSVITDPNITNAQIIGIKTDKKQTYKNVRTARLIRRSSINTSPIRKTVTRTKRMRQKWHMTSISVTSKANVVLAFAICSYVTRLYGMVALALPKLQNTRLTCNKTQTGLNWLPIDQVQLSDNFNHSNVRKQLDAGFIEPAVFKLSSQVLFVPLKDSQVHFFVDFCKLN